MYEKKIRDLRKAAGIFSWESDPRKNSYEYISPEEKRKAIEKIRERHDKFVNASIGGKIHRYTKKYIEQNKLSPEEAEAKRKLAKEISNKYRDKQINIKDYSFINGKKKVDLGIGGATTTVVDKPSHKEEKYLKSIINKETGIRLKHDTQYKKHLSKKIDDLMEEMLKNHKSENIYKFDAEKHLNDVTKDYDDLIRADKFRKMRNARRVGGAALLAGGLAFGSHLMKKRQQEKRD